jgi:deazaflavin-dependent oxidoreductase (nitroreductase family)
VRETAVPDLPTGLRRAWFRLPVRLYRAHLGWVLGRRFVLVEHRGRLSGRVRDVVIEVVGREDGTLLVASGYGTRSNWYRNLRADPRARVTTGLRTWAVRAVPLTADEGAAVMSRYAARHPVAARGLSRYMGFVVESRDDFALVGRHVPFLRLVPFDPADGSATRVGGSA